MRLRLTTFCTELQNTLFMLIIRFARRGRRNRAFYDLVVAEKARAVQKKYVEKLGYFDPHTDGGAGKFEYDIDAVKKYIGNGAQMSDSVAKKLTKAGVKEAEKFVLRRASKPPKPVEAPEPKAEELVAENAEETSAAEEAKAEEPKAEVVEESSAKEEAASEPKATEEAPAAE